MLLCTNVLSRKKFVYKEDGRNQEVAHSFTNLSVHLQEALLPGPWVLDQRWGPNVSSLLPTQTKKPRSFLLGSPTSRTQFSFGRLQKRLEKYAKRGFLHSFIPRLLPEGIVTPPADVCSDCPAALGVFEEGQHWGGF